MGNVPGSCGGGGCGSQSELELDGDHRKIENPMLTLGNGGDYMK